MICLVADNKFYTFEGSCFCSDSMTEPFIVAHCVLKNQKDFSIKNKESVIIMCDRVSSFQGVGPGYFKLKSLEVFNFYHERSLLQLTGIVDYGQKIMSRP